MSHESNAWKDMDRADTRFVVFMVALLLISLGLGILHDGIGWWLVMLVCSEIAAGGVGFTLGARRMRQVWQNRTMS